MGREKNREGGSANKRSGGGDARGGDDDNEMDTRRVLVRPWTKDGF